MELKTALDLLVACAERWEVLDVILDTWSLRELTSVIPHRTPALKKIRIVDADAKPHDLNLFNSSAPLNHLADLSIFSHVSFHTGRPLPNLRNVCFNSVDTLDVIDCLSHCPCLEELVIRFEDWSHGPVPVMEIKLPHLRTFKATLDEDSDSGYDIKIAQLFENIRVPHLQTLFINFDRDPENGLTWVAVQNLLRRVDNTLENFEMWTCMSTPLEFGRCVELLPRLKYLACPDIFLHNEDVRACIFRRKLPMPCPNLTTIRLIKGHGSGTLDSYMIIPPTLFSLQSRMDLLKTTRRTPVLDGGFTVVVWEDAALFVRHYANRLPGIKFLDLDDWISRRKHDLYTDVGRAAWEIN
ncbi:hypothetical protein BD410DRAFT_801959 [Rickenella mellea]|uniref:F-box domain-containing protein n=1 Tax=Rickenella mellea TaxID=50990 RepID=A0A4Y7QAE5_9AGAM|nr:hypothetical protein BD410DRAFT_801959 [Rickenella mellea]